MIGDPPLEERNGRFSGDPFGIGGYTLAELAELERIVGVPFDRLTQAPSRALMMAGLLYIKRKRTDPAVTLDDVMKTSLEEINAELEADGVGPTPARGASET